MTVEHPGAVAGNAVTPCRPFGGKALVHLGEADVSKSVVSRSRTTIGSRCAGGEMATGTVTVTTMTPAATVPATTRRGLPLMALTCKYRRAAAPTVNASFVSSAATRPSVEPPNAS